MKTKYRIGNVVLVKAVVLRIQNQLDRGMSVKHTRNEITPISAYVVGITTRFDGKVIHGSGYVDYFGESDYDPPSFKVEGSHRLLLLRRSIRTKEFLAFPEDCTLSLGNPEEDYANEKLRMNDEQKKAMEFWRYKCPKCGRFSRIFGEWESDGPGKHKYTEKTIFCKIHGHIDYENIKHT